MPSSEDQPARMREIIRILLNCSPGGQHMQNCREINLPLKHSFERMNPELNSSFIHGMIVPLSLGYVHCPGTLYPAHAFLREEHAVLSFCQGVVEVQ